jgi:hypothetical protein
MPRLTTASIARWCSRLLALGGAAEHDGFPFVRRWVSTGDDPWRAAEVGHMARQATNLARGVGVIPADKHPSRERGEASMFSSTLKRSVTSLAVMAGLLAVAGPAGASPTNLHATPSPAPFIVAGNGSDIYVVTDNKDPDVLRGPRSAKWEVSELDAGVSGFMDYTDDALVFSGDAYDNEMGITAAGDDVPARRQTKVSAILMADAGGQY